MRGGAPSHLLTEELHRLGAAVHALPSLGDALLVGDHDGLLVILKVLAALPVARQDDLTSLGLCFRHQLRHKLGAVLVEERLANVHAVDDLHERVGHPADAHDAVRLIDQILNHQNLVGDLRTSDDGSQRALHLRRIENL